MWYRVASVSLQQAEQIIQQFVTAGFPDNVIAQLKQQPIESLVQMAQQYRLPNIPQSSTPGNNVYTGMAGWTINPNSIGKDANGQNVYQAGADTKAFYDKAMQSAQSANKAYKIPPAQYTPLLPDPGGINRPPDPNTKMYVRFVDGTNGYMTYDQAVQMAAGKQGKAWVIKS